MSKQWFRVYADMPENPKIGMLDDASYRCWIECLCFAAQQGDSGRIGTLQEINWKLRRDYTEQLKILITRDAIRLNGDVYYVKNWRHRQYESDSSKTRTQKYRAAKKLDKSKDDVTSQQSHGDVTVTPPEQNRTDTEINPLTPLQGDDGSFEEFWMLFPKQRAGSKAKALAAYRQALKRASHDEIMGGLKAYVESDEVARGFAKGAAAWLNDDRWTCDYGKTQPAVATCRQSSEVTRKIGRDEYDRALRLVNSVPDPRGLQRIISAYRKQNPREVEQSAPANHRQDQVQQVEARG